MAIEIQNHRMTAIASDGQPIKPIVVDRIGLTSGERYDFVLTANQNVGNYWIRLFTNDPGCPDGDGEGDRQEFAILRYDGAPVEDPLEIFSGNADGIYLNPKSSNDNPDDIQIVDVESAVPTDVRLLGEPDLKYYMAVGIRKISHWNLYDKTDYPNPVLSEFRRNTRQLNYMSFKTPSSPLLTQFKDIPKQELCFADEIPVVKEECIEGYCNCVQIIDIPLGKMVEIIVVVSDDIFGADHPMHMHSYSFRVVGYGKLARGTTLDDVIQLDKQGNISRHLNNAVVKDSVQVQGDGYTIMRFVADNPGWWFFHCHKIYHVADGMGIVLRVGEPSDLPPIPAKFPQCGSWSEDDESEYVKERKHGEAPLKNGEKSRKTKAG